MSNLIERLMPQEFNVLLKEQLGMYISRDEVAILERAREKNKRIIESLRGTTFDVYLTGHIDFERVVLFYRIAEELEKNGITVYYPAMVVMDPKEKGLLELRIGGSAKVLLVVTDVTSYGTSVDIGFFTHRKFRGEDVKIVVCFTGLEHDLRVMMNHPSSVLVDYFTKDIEDAVLKTVQFVKELRSL
ncbi:hypothetical protein [Pyrococcus abyssi]|uniref:hypothetical protein n=1 Tax=Pyrococcus abyssi TaxID=29292 RepID=UPI001E452C23|nr:hypothetical protein [Pyrococcus abyssi]